MICFTELRKFHANSTNDTSEEFQVAPFVSLVENCVQMLLWGREQCASSTVGLRILKLDSRGFSARLCVCCHQHFWVLAFNLSLIR